MRALFVLAAMLLGTLAGCAQSPTNDAVVPTDCQFPNVTPGSNAYFVGVVRDAKDAVLSQVEARAEPIGGGPPTTDSTNDSGCFFLSLTPDAHYRVTFTRTGFQTQTLNDASVPSGGKTVRTIVMPAQ